MLYICFIIAFDIFVYLSSSNSRCYSK